MLLLEALLSRGLAENEIQARGLILSAKVLVNEVPVTKTGAKISETDDIRIRGVRKFVSRAGEKLDAALEAFAFPVAGRTFLDIGASTGGFTDSLLQRGAANVAAIDVGRGLLHQKLRNDPRVQVIEDCDFRKMEASVLKHRPEAFVADVSFTSLNTIIPRAFSLLVPRNRPAEAIILFKPQFEISKAERDILKKGVLKDPQKALQLVQEFTEKIKTMGVEVIGVQPAAVKGRKGNQEYLLHLMRQQ